MMKLSRRSPNVISLVLLITFGLLAAVIGYATIKGGNFELRSKAATKDILLKQWTFDAGSQEWTAGDWGSQSAGKGVYSLVVDTKTERREQKEVCTGSKKRGNEKCRNKTVVTPLDPHLLRGSVDTVLLYPQNRFGIKLSVTLPATETSPLAKKPAKTPVTFSVRYKMEGKSTFENPVPLTVNANAGIQDVAFAFPKGMSLKKITDIRISFADIKSRAGAVIVVDDIRLVGLKEVDKGDTVIGFVTKVAGDSQEGANPRAAYRLRGYYEKQTDKKLHLFVLMPGWDPIDCPPGKACPQIAKRIQVNLEEFVGKDVIVTGTVSDSDPSITGNGMQILYVTSIELNLPCQEVPAGCTDENGAMRCKIALKEGYRWCEPSPTPVVGAGCELAGCSNELCVDAGTAAGRVSKCVYLPSYACFQSATCEKQAGGLCGWTMTQEVSSCIESSR